MPTLYEALRGPFQLPAAQRIVVEKSATAVKAPEVVLQASNKVRPVADAPALIKKMTTAHAAKNAARYAELHVTPLTQAYDIFHPQG